MVKMKEIQTYQLHFYEDEKELIEEFDKVVNQMGISKRKALLVGMKMFIQKYKDIEIKWYDI